MMCSDFYSKYTIKNKIGHGTFSEVLRCENNITGKSFAVKILKKQFKHHSDAETMPELLVLEKLPQHPNVLPLIEYMFNQSDRKVYIVFELMDMSLYDLIIGRKRCIPESKVKYLFYQILKGVEHLHSNGIFHRDIKPENILVKKTSVKLADMGSVRGFYSEQPYTDYISTRWYRAPECMLTSGCYNYKVDVWACGCVFYELLTSKPIFPGANEIDQLTKIHQFVGTPNSRVLMKIKNKHSRIGDIKFPNYPSINIAIILPFTSETGRDVLKRTLVYDPDLRTTVRRLLEHRYFNDLREDNPKKLRNLKEFSSPLELNNTFIHTKKMLKPKNSAVFKQEKEDLVLKIVKKSYVPSHSNSITILAPQRSKPCNLVSPAIQLGQLPNKLVNKKKLLLQSESKQTVNSDLKQGVKQQKSKSYTLGSLPTINKQLRKVKISKSPVSDSHLKTLSKGFLPSIPEH